MCERGFVASGVKEIVARGEAPIGSFYHHFPGGKSELARETLQMHAEKTRELLVAVFSAPGPIEERVRTLFSRAASGFEERGGTKSCAVGTVALDLDAEESLLKDACRAAFRSWEGALAPLFPWEDEGKRTSFAQMIVIALEGAFVRGRADGSGAAFSTAGECLAAAAASFGE